MPLGSNNCFGIKDTDRYPGAVYTMTTEWRGGRLVSEKHGFEVYPSLAECFIDHGKLLTGGYGRNVYSPAWIAFQLNYDVDIWMRSIAPIYAPGNREYAKVILATAHSVEVLNAITKVATGFGKSIT